MKKVIKYNKLIRDSIPEIVKRAGWLPTVRTLERGEFLNALKKKVLEEAGELIQAKDKKGIIDEMVDLRELLDALALELKLKREELKKFQKIKRKNRGGFKKRLFLIKQEKKMK